MELKNLQTPIQYLKGVGPYLSTLLKKKGIETVQDLLFFFPVRYLDRRVLLKIRQLTPGKNRTLVAEVLDSGVRPLKRRRIFEMVVKDETGIALVVWFHFNEKYLRSKYPPGKKLLIFGDCQYFGAHKQFVHPQIDDWDEEASETNLLIEPLYSSTDGLYQKTICRIVRNALDQYLPSLVETPVIVRPEGTRVTLKESLLKIHCPPVDCDLEAMNRHQSPWHQRVIYDELFFLQLGLGLKKTGCKQDNAYPMDRSGLPRRGLPSGGSLVDRALKLLPFVLTEAQKRSFEEIREDLKKQEPMNRLLQGDVGSGKTLVAFLAALIAAENGFQTALMVPTEILAQQHNLNLSKIAAPLDIRMACLTGSTTKSERNEILADLSQNRIQIIFGTHALIQEGVVFGSLGLVVIDEQHRFGVLQRAALHHKGGDLQKSDPLKRSPHILVMTATPIPRTLTMSLYGDLDLSVIDELPQGRKSIITHVFREKMRSLAYDIIKREMKKGRQAYFVYPLIEESEKIDLKNAITMAEQLKEVFGEYSVGLLHGRMMGAEKEEIMARFKAKKIDLLVSTTVIEVGVDVPNSTIMVVEHAERFGLSQLHQLRGRVGRGGDQSYCLLMAGYAQSEEGRFRLRVMEQTNDGFKIAEEDLKLRGPGEFLGTRQSGLPDFKIADLVRDGRLLNAARKRAFEILDDDPLLSREEHFMLKKTVSERWGKKLSLADVS